MLPSPDARFATLFLVSVLGAAIASMPVYALLGKRRDADADGKGAQLFLGIGDFLLHWFLWAIGPVVWLSMELGLTPDFYNFAGLLLGLLSGILIADGKLPLAGWAIASGGICDILDGRIARLTGVASAYGDFVDATFDRFVEAFTFLGFVVLLRTSPLAVFLASAAMAGSLLVSYTRARGEVLGVTCSGGLMQRGERLLLACLACLFDPLAASRFGWGAGTLTQWMLGLVAVTTFVTAVHRVVWISGRLRNVAGGV
jgi:CDP-diacylglycerol---glycerol-3-phosphate 3-phosphatidyltransferase